MKSILALCGAAACVAACTHPSPQWESRFGDSSRQLRAAQVIDPAAPSRAASASGIDGKAAAGAMKAYAESYGYAVKESKQPAVTIAPTPGAR